MATYEMKVKGTEVTQVLHELQFNELQKSCYLVNNPTPHLPHQYQKRLILKAAGAAHC